MDETTVIQTIRTLAKLSSEQILPIWHQGELEVELKADQTPVTIADRRAEEVMRDYLVRECPHHGIIGEEFPNDNTEAEYTWVLDPIDGTKAFTAGCPLFGTLIGLRRGNRAVWGAIHIPVMNLLYIGNNEQSWCNDRQIRMRFTPQLNHCTLLTTDPRTPQKMHSPRGWDKIIGQYRDVQKLGR
ncbi:MAG: histidinol-phosphatase, partial [Verrucomicrobia bacterium]|nr:histidinol-phosphatase [Verrucomicrobiota bacterium]